MTIKVTCYDPAKKVRICEGGWQLPEVLRSFDECDEIEETFDEPVEKYCSGTATGIDLTIDDSLTTLIAPQLENNYPLSTTIDSIDISNTFLAGKNTIKWTYNVKHNVRNDTRSGEILAVWNEELDDVGFTDNSTNDLGDTSEIEFDVTLTSNLVNLVSIVDSGEWKIKVVRS